MAGTGSTSGGQTEPALWLMSLRDLRDRFAAKSHDYPNLRSVILRLPRAKTIEAGLFERAAVRFSVNINKGQLLPGYHECNGSNGERWNFVFYDTDDSHHWADFHDLANEAGWVLKDIPAAFIASAPTQWNQHGIWLRVNGAVNWIAAFHHVALHQPNASILRGDMYQLDDGLLASIVLTNPYTASVGLIDWLVKDESDGNNTTGAQDEADGPEHHAIDLTVRGIADYVQGNRI